MMVKWRRVKRYNKKSVKGECSEVHNTLALFIISITMDCIKQRGPLFYYL